MQTPWTKAHYIVCVYFYFKPEPNEEMKTRTIVSEKMGTKNLHNPHNFSLLFHVNINLNVCVWVWVCTNEIHQRGQRERQGAKLNQWCMSLSLNTYLKAQTLWGLMGLLTLFQVLGLWKGYELRGLMGGCWADRFLSYQLRCNWFMESWFESQQGCKVCWFSHLTLSQGHQGLVALFERNKRTP